MLWVNFCQSLRVMEKEELIIYIFFLRCSPLMVIFESVTFFLLLFCQQGGCVDSRHQSLALLYMILGQRDVSKLLTGPLTPYT